MFGSGAVRGITWLLLRAVISDPVRKEGAGSAQGVLEGCVEKVRMAIGLRRSGFWGMRLVTGLRRSDFSSLS